MKRRSFVFLSSVAAISAATSPDNEIPQFMRVDPIVAPHHSLEARTLKDYLYGKEISILREKIQATRLDSVEYARTGIHDHHVDYDLNTHPLASDEMKEAASVGSTRKLNYISPSEASKPLRITWFTTELDKRSSSSAANKAKVDIIKSRILPDVAGFWRNALRVTPVRGPLKVAANQLMDRRYCISSYFSEVPSDHMANGVPDTDLVIYVSANNDSGLCSGGKLASAGFCNSDQFDRPIAGSANICLDQFQLDSNLMASDASIEKLQVVLMHEVGHILGFLGYSLQFFWDPETKEPRTRRPFLWTNVTCTNGEISLMPGFPSENTLTFIDDASTGKRSAYVVTPKVKTVARNQFNCHDLEGAALENLDTSQSCIGSHWDERMFYSESMSGIISPTTNVLSPLTLAFFEDSGWYFANYSDSEISPFGYGAGCDFVRKPCLVKNGEEESAFVPSYSRGSFCGESAAGCSPSSRYKMWCGFNPVGPPSQFQYFGNPLLGGVNALLDYCPVYSFAFLRDDQDYIIDHDNHDCREPTNSDVNVPSLYQEEFGENSICVDTNFRYPICYKHKCDVTTQKLSIGAFGSWYECKEDFDIIYPYATGTDPSFALICPRISMACPNLFCPHNCEGRGKCNWDAEGGARCECFDTSDTSEICSERPELAGTSSTGQHDFKMMLWFSATIMITSISLY